MAPVTTAPTGVVPGPSRAKLVPLTPVTGSLKVAVTLVLTPTFVAAASDIRLETVGGVVSAAGAVVNVQLSGARALGVAAVSVMAPVRRAV